MTRILNIGSLNIDRVFRVSAIARPGETVASRSVKTFAGGKGANQSVALARAGARVAHAGKIGADGTWLTDCLARDHVDTTRIAVGTGSTGQATIQVDDSGQNAIVLFAGENHEITPADVDSWLDDWPAGAWLLVQNETSAVPHAIEQAHSRGMRVAFNPAPMDDRVASCPLELVDILCVNATEGAALAACTAPDEIVNALAARYSRAEVVLTLGEQGVLYHGPEGRLRLPACRAQAVDTTAAGDTFLGYYLADRAAGRGARESLDMACRAAAVCVTRAGALASIPRRDEIPLVD
jgi:ribokinase